MKLAAMIYAIMITLDAGVFSGEVLFSDDFSSGELESNWILYGDPQSGILDSRGTPPPCFINNGDSMFGSGVISREIFPINNGIAAECDIYLECLERGAWVSASLRLVTPNYRNESTRTDYAIASVFLSYLGELNWNRPHLQTVLLFTLHNIDGLVFRYELIHQNHLLDDWHNYRLVLDEDRFVSLYIDENLIISTPEPISDSIESISIQLGDRSSDWGMALHDNLVVFRP